MKPQTKHEMRIPADIVVYSPDRQPLLIVEVQEDTQVSAQDAADQRHLWLSHGLLADGAFFLLAYPKTLFLWRRETPAADLPDYVASATSIFDYKKVGIAETTRCYKAAMQFFMFSWLSVLTSSLRYADPESAPEKMLIDSGVYVRMLDGDVRFEGDL